MQITIGCEFRQKIHASDKAAERKPPQSEWIKTMVPGAEAPAKRALQFRMFCWIPELLFTHQLARVASDFVPLKRWARVDLI